MAQVHIHADNSEELFMTDVKIDQTCSYGLFNTLSITTKHDSLSIYATKAQLRQIRDMLNNADLEDEEHA